MQWHRLFFFQPTTVVELRKAPAAMSASGNAGATQRTMRDERVSVQKAARQVRKLPEKNSMSKTPSGKAIVASICWLTERARFEFARLTCWISEACARMISQAFIAIKAMQTHVTNNTVTLTTLPNNNRLNFRKEFP